MFACQSFDQTYPDIHSKYYILFHLSTAKVFICTHSLFNLQKTLLKQKDSPAATHDPKLTMPNAKYSVQKYKDPHPPVTPAATAALQGFLWFYGPVEEPEEEHWALWDFFFVLVCHCEPQLLHFGP